MNERMDRRMDELVTTGLQQWTVTQQMVINYFSPLYPAEIPVSESFNLQL